jgi:hypothetical protein
MSSIQDKPFSHQSKSGAATAFTRATAATAATSSSEESGGGRFGGGKSARSSRSSVGVGNATTRSRSFHGGSKSVASASRVMTGSRGTATAVTSSRSVASAINISGAATTSGASRVSRMSEGGTSSSGRGRSQSRPREVVNLRGRSVSAARKPSSQTLNNNGQRQQTSEERINSLGMYRGRSRSRPRDENSANNNELPLPMVRGRSVSKSRALAGSMHYRSDDTGSDDKKKSKELTRGATTSAKTNKDNSQSRSKSRGPRVSISTKRSSAGSIVNDEGVVSVAAAATHAAAANANSRGRGRSQSRGRTAGMGASTVASGRSQSRGRTATASTSGRSLSRGRITSDANHAERRMELGRKDDRKHDADDRRDDRKSNDSHTNSSLLKRIGDKLHSKEKKSSSDIGVVAAVAALQHVNGQVKLNLIREEKNNGTRRNQSHQQQSRSRQYQQNSHPASNPRQHRSQFQRKESRSLSPHRYRSRSPFDRRAMAMSSAKSVDSCRSESTSPGRYYNENDDASVSSSRSEESYSSKSSYSSSSSSSYSSRGGRRLRSRSSSPVAPQTMAASIASVRRNSNNTRNPYQPKSSSEMAICSTLPTSAEIVTMEDALSQVLDDNGCCILHPFIQLKMKLPSGNWRTLSKQCVVCQEENNDGGNDGDDIRAMVPAVGRPAFTRRMSNDSGTFHRKSSLGKYEDTARTLVPVDQTSLSSRSSTASSVEDDDDDGEDSNSLGRSRVEYDDNSLTPSCLEEESELVRIPTRRSSNKQTSVSSSSASSSSEESESVECDERLSQSYNSLDEPPNNPLRNRRASQESKNPSVEMPPRDVKVSSRRPSGYASDDSYDSTKKTKSIDMSRVENALKKIKSLEEIQQASKAPASTVTASRSPPPPPPPPPKSASSKSQSDKNVSFNAPPQKKTQQAKPVSPPPAANSTSVQRAPPPPPPRPPIKSIAIDTSVTDKEDGIGNFSGDYGCSMAVLNPEPEPELQNDFVEDSGLGFDDWGRGQEDNLGAIDDADDTLGNKEWMKYATLPVRNVEDRAEKRGKRFGRASEKLNNHERQSTRHVKQMPYTDQFGEFGLYTGQVNEEGRPDGKGAMKYDNGVFYEGAWTDGGQDQKAASQYGRIRGGFTSWQGKGKNATKSGMVLPWNARKNDTQDPNEKTNVRGMEWTDLNGDSGRYTGEVNYDKLPHGNGIMRFDFGLIAEGEWINGVLKEGPRDRLLGAATVAAAASSGRSIGPGMSVGPGAQGFSAAASVMGGMSVAQASAFGGPMPVYPPVAYGGMNPMMIANQQAQASQYAMIAQQNAMMRAGGSVHGGAGGSIYGGMMPQLKQMQMPQQQQQQQKPQPNKPPISEIKIT